MVLLCAWGHPNLAEGALRYKWNGKALAVDRLIFEFALNTNQSERCRKQLSWWYGVASIIQLLTCFRGKPYPVSPIKRKNISPVDKNKSVEEIKWLKGCNQYTQLDWMKMPNKCNFIVEYYFSLILMCWCEKRFTSSAPRPEACDDVRWSKCSVM